MNSISLFRSQLPLPFPYTICTSNSSRYSISIPIFLNHLKINGIHQNLLPSSEFNSYRQDLLRINSCSFPKLDLHPPDQISSSCFVNLSISSEILGSDIKNLEKGEIMWFGKFWKGTKSCGLKFDKYWGTINKMNIMLFIAVVLDPRYKMKILKVKYEAHYSENDAKELVEKVTFSLKTLIEDHRVLNEESGDCDSSPSHGIDTIMEEDVDEFFLEEENQRKAATKDELDMYLEEAAEAYTRDFNILLWWKVNSVRYPNLSCVARDVLAIQSSTVASESAFSTGGRTLHRFRSSLTPTTAEVLICSQDWLRNSKASNNIEELVEDMMKLEMGATEDPEIKDSISGRIALEC